MKAFIVPVILSFILGLLSGAWLLNKVYVIDKVNQLENYIDKQSASHHRTMKSLQQVHKKELKIASDSVKIERVAEYVKDNRECDISDGAEQLLDRSRTGVSTAAGRNDEAVRSVAAITQRQQIESCARDGIQYRQLKVTYDALRLFIQENWKPP